MVQLKLCELIKGIECIYVQGEINREIDDICYNSASCSENSLFVCIKGSVSDGHNHVSDAIEKGSLAVVCSRDIKVPSNITLIKVKDTRKTLADISSVFFENPSGKMKTIGITGTKGKTTTAYMIKALLSEAGYKVGMIGTVEIDTGIKKIENRNTTPESYEIQKALSEMESYGCDVAVIEVSSQGLKLQRVENIYFDYGIFTNISEDHIGVNEHKDFDEYLYYKTLLFQKCKTGIINMDDTYYNKIIKKRKCDLVTFGFDKKADLVCSEYENIKSNTKFGVEIKLKGVYNISLVVNIPGKFTVYNVMCALALCSRLSIGEEHIKNALSNVKIPGRDELIFMENGGVILIDYAHNGVSLGALLTSLQVYKPNKIICVFGCGGQRDIGRRFQMGEVSAKFANYTIITSDNPRNEPPKNIINDIIKGMSEYKCRFEVIEDRRDAIEKAVRICGPGQIAVIAGKGHETYQIIGNKKIHFDDREEVLKSIEKVKNEQNYSS